MTNNMKSLVSGAVLLVSFFCGHASLAQMNLRSTTHEPAQAASLKASSDKLEAELVAKYGEGQRARLQRGMQQVVSFWRAEDGDASAFEDLVRTNFAGDQKTQDTMFTRFEYNLEQLRP